uniref:ARGOS-like protein n=1 Tax=Oryza punctata TaxID=4537 RepID=A0A0E0MEB2_ORYPU
MGAMPSSGSKPNLVFVRVDQTSSRVGFVAMEGVVDARQRRNPLLPRPNGSKRHLQHQHYQQHQPNAAEKKAAASNYFSIEAFLVLVFLTMSLLILPLVLPPLPPPPSLLLLLPVCLLILLVVLAFMPTDVRNMASSYL